MLENVEDQRPGLLRLGDLSRCSLGEDGSLLALHSLSQADDEGPACGVASCEAGTPDFC